MGTMTFNVFEMGTEEAVCNAFQVLSDGGVVIEPSSELPWSYKINKILMLEPLFQLPDIFTEFS